MRVNPYTFPSRLSQLSEPTTIDVMVRGRRGVTYMEGTMNERRVPCWGAEVISS